MGSDDGGGRSGFSRRRLLQGAGGAGAVAAVSIVGLGQGTAAAGTAATAGAAGDAAAPQARPGALRSRAPHAMVRRSYGTRPGVALQPGGGSVTILPIDRAMMLAGGRFDLRVEAAGVDPRTARIDIAVEGPGGPARVLEGEPRRSSSEDGSLEVTYPGVRYPRTGTYTVTATVTSGATTMSSTVTHEVPVPDRPSRRAKNVIFFLGDGMGQGAITGARVLSKGITEGKYGGRLEMDLMEYRGIVGTSGADALATDSANSMSAYMCGHKSSVSAMGVYESNAENFWQHPKVETMAELLKRTRDMGIGVVTTSEVQDATPAAVFAHTRERSEYVDIMDQALRPEVRPDVLMGGGLASLLPQGTGESEREDGRNLVDEFKTLGYTYVDTATALAAATDGRPPERLLGLFHDENLNVYLDRRHAPDPEVLGVWNDQPTLPEMTRAALDVLERHDNGFFLMVEGASIDKMEHPLDGPRALYDTIELDQALGVAKEWASDRDDTLIVVVADHNHSMSIVGTRSKSGPEGRDGNGVYGDAAFPTYADTNGDGFPDDPDPEISLFFGWNNHPDHADDFLHDARFLEPALEDEQTELAVPNPEKDQGAVVQVGNIPRDQTNCVHTVDDVAIVASGPGSSRFNGFLDNTEVFFAMVDALGIDARDGH